MRRFPLWSLLALSGCVASCAATDEARCQSGADCASGMCGSDGRCIDESTGTAGDGAGMGGTAGSGGDSGGAGGGQGGAGACQPNRDGVITQAELPIEVGLSEKLLSAQNANLDSAGSDNGDGTRSWDFTASQPGDHLTLFETRTLDGTWFSALFPGASYAARLADAEELLGVFEIGSDALLLRGVVSPQDGLTRTELSYDPPIAVLDFPLSEGAAWNASATVSGLAQGVAVFYTESYSFNVDARGAAQTPFASFAVLRVHTTIVRTIGALTMTTQQHSFVSECFGSVAAMASQPGQLGVEFSDLAELRRLSP